MPSSVSRHSMFSCMMAAVSALVIALTAATMILLDRVYGLDRVLVGKH